MSAMHSIELERAVLGRMLFDNSVIGHDTLPSLFAEPEHARICSAALAAQAAGQVVDSFTVFERIKNESRESGGLEYLHGLTQDVPSTVAFKGHVAKLRELAARRHMAALIENPLLPLSEVASTVTALALSVAPRATHAAFHALDVHQLAQMQFKQREVFLAPWLHSQDLCMIFAARGIGKTHFGIATAYALATAGKFAKWWAPKPRRVVYLDGELPGAVMQQRLLMHCGDVEPEPGFLRVFTPDLLPDGYALPDLSTYEGQAAIDALFEPETEVVFIDNLSAWARSGRENEAESWQPIAAWILQLRRRGIAVVLVHHAGKGGQQRGTSKREDLLDVVIGLSRPKDYTPDQGAVFVAEFTKARNLAGTDAESIELALGGTDEQAVWTWRTVESSTYDRVVVLAKEGLSPGEICSELEINKSNVSRALRKARELGDLPPEAKK